MSLDVVKAKLPVWETTNKLSRPFTADLIFRARFDPQPTRRERYEHQSPEATFTGKILHGEEQRQIIPHSDFMALLRTAPELMISVQSFTSDDFYRLEEKPEFSSIEDLLRKFGKQGGFGNRNGLGGDWGLWPLVNGYLCAEKNDINSQYQYYTNTLPIEVSVPTLVEFSAPTLVEVSRDTLQPLQEPVKKKIGAAKAVFQITNQTRAYRIEKRIPHYTVFQGLAFSYGESVGSENVLFNVWNPPRLPVINSRGFGDYEFWMGWEITEAAAKKS